MKTQFDGWLVALMCAAAMTAGTLGGINVEAGRHQRQRAAAAAEEPCRIVVERIGDTVRARSASFSKTCVVEFQMTTSPGSEGAKLKETN